MLDFGVSHQRQKLGADAVLGSWNTDIRHDFMRIDPVDHSSGNWLVVTYQGYYITTTSDATITALGVESRWKASDLLLYDPNSSGTAEQVSTTAVPTKTFITAASLQAYSSIAKKPRSGKRDDLTESLAATFLLRTNLIRSLS